MKKSLFAIAAVTAFAGAAQAQSSVTVYGILDVGYIGATSKAVNNSTALAPQGGQAKTTVNQIGQSAETTSRLGFKGNEDLGGGMSAFFTAEFQLYPQEQDVSGNANGGLLNRQTFVGLKKNGIGQAAVGTQYTPVYVAGSATSPGQFNNMLGDVIYQGASIASLKDGNNGSVTASITNRTSNTLTVKSDTFAGFSANAMYTLNNSNTTSQANAGGEITKGGQSNASGWGLGAEYTFQKFYATAAMQQLKQLTSANEATTTPAAWTGAQPSNNISAVNASATAVLANAVNVQDNQFLLGATYDFGILKAYAQYVNRKATATASSDYYLKRTAQQIGVRSFITPKVEGWASVGTGRYTSAGEGEPTRNFNGWQLGSNYLLSKRTNLYAIYGQQLYSTATNPITGATGSASGNNYAVGVRHTF